MFSCFILLVLAAFEAAGQIQTDLVKEGKDAVAAPIAAKLHGDTSLELASVLSDLSGPQRALGKKKEALLSLESALRMRELHPTELLAEYANDLLRTSTIRIDMGETGPAKDLLTRALAA